MKIRYYLILEETTNNIQENFSSPEELCKYLATQSREAYRYKNILIFEGVIKDIVSDFAKQYGVSTDYIYSEKEFLEYFLKNHQQVTESNGSTLDKESSGHFQFL